MGFRAGVEPGLKGAFWTFNFPAGVGGGGGGEGFRVHRVDRVYRVYGVHGGLQGFVGVYKGFRRVFLGLSGLLPPRSRRSWCSGG